MVPCDRSAWLCIADATGHEVDTWFNCVVTIAESGAAFASAIVWEASWVIITYGTVTGSTAGVIRKYARFVFIDTSDPVSDSNHITWAREVGTGTIVAFVTLTVAVF